MFVHVAILVERRRARRRATPVGRVLDDDAGHDVYQVHELHKRFIERNKPHWKRVQIYDFK